MAPLSLIFNVPFCAFNVFKYTFPVRLLLPVPVIVNAPSWDDELLTLFKLTVTAVVEPLIFNVPYCASSKPKYTFPVRLLLPVPVIVNAPVGDDELFTLFKLTVTAFVKRLIFNVPFSAFNVFKYTFPASLLSPVPVIVNVPVGDDDELFTLFKSTVSAVVESRIYNLPFCAFS